MRVSVYIPAALHDALSTLSTDRNRPVGYLVAQAVAFWLAAGAPAVAVEHAKRGPKPRVAAVRRIAPKRRTIKPT